MSSFGDVYGLNLNNKFKERRPRRNSVTVLSRSSAQNKQDIFFIRALDKIKENEKYEGVNCNLDYILQYLKTYCNITTLHGFNYILKPGSALFERIFWIVALITVWLGVIFAIHNQVLNYINSSVVISVSGEKVSILDAPFPAITICSKNQMRPSLLNSAETISNKSPSDLKRLHVYSTLASFCEASSIGDYNYDIQLNHSIIRDDWEFFYFWKQIASDECRNIFKQVKWKNVRADDPCRDAEASMTVDGICYSFNLMSPSKRYNEKYGAFHIFSLSTSLNGEPQRKNGDDSSGLQHLSGGTLFTSAKIFLDFNADDISEECKSKGYGFLVRVHNPFEDPQGHQPAFIDVDKTTVIKILPEIITSSQNLATWNPLDRGCYFNHERKLKFYKVYTQLNCEIECQANITMKQCGCNMFYQIYSFTESKICEPDQFQCVLNITNNEIGKEQNPCGCLPGCNEYEYEMRSYPTTQTWAESLNSSSGISTYGFHLDRNKLKSYSSIKLEYNNEGIAKKSRIGIYSFTGFIAQIGGLLGLFVGFSLVSLIEIIYFTSIRWVATNAENNKSANNMPSTFMN